MDRRTRYLLAQARTWHKEGIISAEALKRIEAKYPDSPDDDPWTSNALYALGGILLGAAVLALLVLLDLQSDVGRQLIFLLLGIAMAGAGAALSRSKAPAGLADGIMLGSLIPLIAAGPGDLDGIGWIAVLASIALLAYRHDRDIPATAGVLGFSVGYPVMLFVTMHESVADETITSTWLAGASVALLAITLVPLLVEKIAKHGPQTVAGLSFAAAMLAFVANVVEPSFRGGIEVYLGLAMLLALVLGVVARAPGLVVASIGVLTIDAVVFAFDVGGLEIGVITLVLLAIAMVTAGILLRRQSA